MGKGRARGEIGGTMMTETLRRGGSRRRESFEPLRWEEVTMTFQERMSCNDFLGPSPIVIIFPYIIRSDRVTVRLVYLSYV